MPRVASTAPMTEVSRSPILSLRIPTRKERKKVVPIVSDPIRADNNESEIVVLQYIIFFYPLTKFL